VFFQREWGAAFSVEKVFFCRGGAQSRPGAADRRVSGWRRTEGTTIRGNGRPSDRDGAAIRRIAHEIVERTPDLANLVLLAIPAGGVPLARQVRDRIREIRGVEVPLGILDITLYRDDVATAGASTTMRASDMPFDVTDKRVILVDDVLFTGRSTRAAPARSRTSGGRSRQLPS
jgi:hypothetical protein